MESFMLKKLKAQNPEKEYPSNIGKKWSNKEENDLLEELDNNIDIESIAQSHNRTIGGINSRRRVLAYKMYSNNISMEEIINKTKLNKYEILETIEKRKNNSEKVNLIPEIKSFSIENEMTEMKNEINSIKNILNELVEMMKAVYEFEDA
jgi:hypothetical protein